MTLGTCALIVHYLFEGEVLTHEIDMLTPVTETACVAAGYALGAILGEPPEMKGYIEVVWDDGTSIKAAP